MNQAERVTLLFILLGDLYEVDSPRMAQKIIVSSTEMKKKNILKVPFSAFLLEKKYVALHELRFLREEQLCGWAQDTCLLSNKKK